MLILGTERWDNLFHATSTGQLTSVLCACAKSLQEHPTL